MGSKPEGLFRNAIAAVGLAIAAAIEPPPDISVSEWADEHRILTRKTSSEPGPWRTDRTPYLREPMDCLSESHPCQRVVIIAGSQVGKSEAGNNWIGYLIDAVGGPIMMVQPTEAAAKKYVNKRLGPLLEVEPCKGRLEAVQQDRGGADRTLYKEFDGGALEIVGANAPAGLASSPIRFLFADEVDRWPKSAGREGAPLAIVRKRTSAFPNRKELVTSTPTVAGESVIEVEFLKTDMRFFHVPCPHCTEANDGEPDGFQVLQFRPTEEHPGGVVWSEENPERPAGYQCEHCGTVIDEIHKPQMLELGEWRGGGHGDWSRDRKVNGERVRQTPGAIGFHISALYSPWYTWSEARDDFLEAKGDPIELQTFLNTVLGQCWDPDYGKTVDDEELLARVEFGFGVGNELGRHEVPAGGILLTGGVDVQPDRIELGVWAWGIGEEAWPIDHVVIKGNTSLPSHGANKGPVWRALDRAVARCYTSRFGDLPIKVRCYDTGHEAENVYSYVKPRQRGFGHLGIKGMADVKGRSRPVWPKRPGRRNKGGIDLYIVGVDTAKAHLYARLGKPEPGAGYVHLAASVCDEEWIRQLTAETYKTKAVRNYSIGHWELKRGRRNEVLDCAVYSYAALKAWLSQRNTLELELDRLERGEDRKPRATREATSRGSFLGGRKRGFVRR